MVEPDWSARKQSIMTFARPFLPHVHSERKGGSRSIDYPTSSCVWNLSKPWDRRKCDILSGVYTYKEGVWDSQMCSSSRCHETGRIILLYAIWSCMNICTKDYCWLAISQEYIVKRATFDKWEVRACAVTHINFDESVASFHYCLLCHCS